ncbi:MAG: cofactor-independent phosphoglycerate mutase [Deltaproteobacteria bacterium]|jgi:2,3-bisphosphoglycerate-independent phosphoglycerate mutase|nr:cofactor-independent phosphoglycerate mutase [Deltaproteobacteria bacterium]
MKYVILIGDGMGDRPVESLGGLTPLQKARTPHLDRLAREGMIARCATVPEGMAPGSDVAIMSLMGYCAKGVLTGRGPLEAAALGLKLDEGDMAFRMNLGTLGHEGGRTVMLDHSAGDVSGEDAGVLVAELAGKLPLLPGMGVHRGVGYRHILIWPGAPEGLLSVPPHDRRDREVDSILDDPGYGPVAELVRASWGILDGHPVNAARKARGRNPANSIWLWGQGRTPKVKSYAERWGITGASVSAVDLIRGLAVATGLDPLTVPGATAWLDTNFEGKVSAALEALKTRDLALVHLEAPDECGHQGDLDAKIRAIEAFDARIVGPILEALPSYGDFRALCSCDHYTPVSIKTHTADPVPFILYDSRNPARSGAAGYSEEEALKAGTMVPDGPSLGRLLFGPEKG